jgi:hypothetical protein
MACVCQSLRATVGTQLLEMTALSSDRVVGSSLTDTSALNISPIHIPDLTVLDVFPKNAVVGRVFFVCDNRQMLSVFGTPERTESG